MKNVIPLRFTGRARCNGVRRLTSISKSRSAAKIRKSAVAPPPAFPHGRMGNHHDALSLAVDEVAKGALIPNTRGKDCFSQYRPTAPNGMST